MPGSGITRRQVLATGVTVTTVLALAHWAAAEAWAAQSVATR